MQPLRQRITQVFGLDLRSVALFRVLYAVVLICEIIGKMEPGELSAFYTDDGVFPRELFFDSSNPYALQLHAMSGRISFQYFLLVLHLAVACCLLVGYYTKTAAVANFLLYSSLWSRNPHVGYGATVLIRVLAFWCVLLPIERVFSLDAAFKDDHTKPRAERISYQDISGVTLGFWMQVCVLYYTTGAHKWSPEWREDYTASFYALKMEAYRTWFGAALLAFPSFLKTVTLLTVWWELVGPFLLVSPLMTEPLRLLAIAGFLAMHVGLQCALHLSLFLPAFTAMLACLLPALAWDQLIFRWLRVGARQKLRIQYSPSSPRLTTLAQWCSFVLPAATQVSQLPAIDDTQEEDAADAQPRRVGIADLWSVTDARGTHYTGVESLRIILLQSPLLSVFNVLLSMPLVSEYLQAWFDATCASELLPRKQIQTKRATRVATSLPRVQRRLLKLGHFAALSLWGVLAGCMVLTLCMWNVGSEEVYLPPRVSWLLRTLHLDQSWSLFAPRPNYFDQWPWILGELDSGRRVELFDNHAFISLTAQEPLKEKPKDMLNAFGGRTWFHWLDHTLPVDKLGRELAPSLCRWLCRRWNAKYHGEERLWHIALVLAYEWHVPDGPNEQGGERVIYEHVCYDKEEERKQAEEGKREAALVQREETPDGIPKKAEGNEELLVVDTPDGVHLRRKEVEHEAATQKDEGTPKRQEG